MIFVTVGTSRFDELARAIDAALGQGLIRQEVIMQIANGSYVPSHCASFRTAPSLDSYYERAALIIGHGGTGTTLEILERGLRLISVANPNVADNHQHEFLVAIERLGYLRYCRDLNQLPEFIAAALDDPPAQPLAVRSLFETLIADLETWRPVTVPRPGRLGRWASRGLKGLRITRPEPQPPSMAAG